MILSPAGLFRQVNFVKGGHTMKRGDVSFTFLNRIEEVELNIKDERWQSALALALTLPDICGGIAFPDIVKRYRDGRVMLDRQKNPTRDVGGQYIRWFDEYAGDFFKVSSKDPVPYICGERCWQLRCEYLHQNKGFLNDVTESSIHFHLGINCGTSVCQLDESNVQNGLTDIRIDIEQFCLRMCRAAKKYYYDVNKEKDFSLYNTPVLDFIQTKKEFRSNPLIVVMCSKPMYANGLSMTLKQISTQILICQAAEEARKNLGKRKPAIWIVTEEMMEQQDQPWRSGINRPVIILTRDIEKDYQIQKTDGKLTVLSFPIQPEVLRNAVKQYLT